MKDFFFAIKIALGTILNSGVLVDIKVIYQSKLV